jgi:predicted Fe-S protein YdhL (DUF1289 family)
MLDVAIWFIEIVIWVRACMQESQERLRWNAAAPKEREMVGRQVEERSNATKLKQKNQKNNNKRSTFDDIECHRQQSLRCIEREKWDSIKNMCKKRAK